MKNLLIILALTLAAGTAQAADLTNCKILVNGKKTQDVGTFTITKFETEEPEFDLDGGLLDFERNAKTTKMVFSNECDNLFEFTFSNGAIAKALDGTYKKLIGKASYATADAADVENPIKGIVTCTVVR